MVSFVLVDHYPTFMKKTLAFLTFVIVAQVAFSQVVSMPLYPQQNAYRNVMDISGIWDFKTDPTNVGESDSWFSNLDAPVQIAVPGSWNDQIEGLHNYFGAAWYMKEVFIPSSWKGSRIFLRVGSANYLAKVWINGSFAGIHEGGHLPFSVEIGKFAAPGTKAVIAIMVENELKEDRVPPAGGKAMTNTFPATSYDFFPYSGLHRNVMLYTVPESSIGDVTVKTSYSGSTGKMDITVASAMANAEGKVIVRDGNAEVATGLFKISGGQGTASVDIPAVKLWSPEDPHLYDVEVTLGKKATDSYTVRTGVRTIEVKGDKLLLNGEPVYLRGYGKHEDFPIFGRGAALPVTVKDFALMKWTGANSFRTSHYPYDESVYEIADREGFLIIDEAPTVGLNFYDDRALVDKRTLRSREMVREMISRDKNHPSVILWSVANEPSYSSLGSSDMSKPAGEAEEKALGLEVLGGLVDLAHEMDPTRPVTFAGVMGGPREWLDLSDVIGINRYYGWYTNPGELEAGLSILRMELDGLHKMFNKPFILTEFGADTIAGNHSPYNVMFSEEFQCEFIGSYLDIASERDYIAGMHIWNFADFQTGVGIIRAGAMNLKGVFTQDRKPKMAASMLHERWNVQKKRF